MIPAGIPDPPMFPTPGRLTYADLKGIAAHYGNGEITPLADGSHLLSVAYEGRVLLFRSARPDAEVAS